MATSKKSSGKTKKNSATTRSGTPPASSKNPADLREGLRVPVQLLVDYRGSNGNYLFDFCKDLGAGGVFIKTDKPMELGSKLDLTFTLPDSKETLRTKGEVIWVQPPIQGRQDLTPGMGVQFAHFHQEQRAMLKDFIQRVHGDKLLTKATASRKTA